MISGTTGNQCDEYLLMSQATCLEAMVTFITVVVRCLEKEHFREPNDKDITRLFTLGVSGSANIQTMVV